MGNRQAAIACVLVWSCGVIGSIITGLYPLIELHGLEYGPPVSAGMVVVISALTAFVVLGISLQVNRIATLRGSGPLDRVIARAGAGPLLAKIRPMLLLGTMAVIQGLVRLYREHGYSVATILKLSNIVMISGGCGLIASYLVIAWRGDAIRKDREISDGCRMKPASVRGQLLLLLCVCGCSLGAMIASSVYHVPFPILGGGALGLMWLVESLRRAWGLQRRFAVAVVLVWLLGSALGAIVVVLVKR